MVLCYIWQSFLIFWGFPGGYWWFLFNQYLWPQYEGIQAELSPHMGACLLISTNLPPGWFHQDHMWSLINEYVVLISNDILCKIQCEKDTSIKEVPKVWNLLYFFVITYDTDREKKTLEPAILLKYIYLWRYWLLMWLV